MGTKTVFTCTSCGHEEPRWLGRCPACGKWNTLLEIPAMGKKGKVTPGKQPPSVQKVVPLSAIDPAQAEGMDTYISEFNRVLGGGMVRGSVILLGGEPGIGKSTLLLQVAGAMGREVRVLYVSGEESPPQIRQRSDRLRLDPSKIHIIAETNLDLLQRSLEEVKPQLVVVDSIQTLYAPELGPLPGTVNQMKYCCHELAEWAKKQGAGVVLVAHITKEGLIAGPKVVEHMVDTVLYFEQGGGELRFLRATKNRFGSVDEIGLFSMGEGGLSPITDPTSVFLVRRQGAFPPGVVIAPLYEGSRVLLLEIQALVVPAKGGISRVYSERIDPGRVSRLAAVLEKHGGVRFIDQDIYVNVAGGMRISEVGVELPLALALYSARTGLPLPAHMAVVGEVSLAGEIRPVAHTRKRFRAAQEMGYTSFLGPTGWEGEGETPGWTGVTTLGEALRFVFTAELAQ
ncbi:MAG: DNA repair protein RadA [Spirochaetales bacterium]